MELEGAHSHKLLVSANPPFHANCAVDKQEFSSLPLTDERPVRPKTPYSNRAQNYPRYDPNCTYTNPWWNKFPPFQWKSCRACEDKVGSKNRFQDWQTHAKQRLILSYQGSDEDDAGRSHNERTSWHKHNYATGKKENSGFSPEDLEVIKSLLNHRKKEKNVSLLLRTICQPEAETETALPQDQTTTEQNHGHNESNRGVVKTLLYAPGKHHNTYKLS